MSISNVNATLKLKVTLPKLIQTLTERYSGQKMMLDFYKQLTIFHKQLFKYYLLPSIKKFTFSKIAGILTCRFTKKRNHLLSLFNSCSATMKKILEDYMWKSSIFIKVVGWRHEATLTINSFTYFPIILTTSAEQLYCRLLICEYDNNEN